MLPVRGGGAEPLIDPSRGSSPQNENKEILPDGYVKAKYIKSSGTQYIDTEVQLSNSIDFGIDMSTTSTRAVTTGSTIKNIFGASDNNLGIAKAINFGDDASSPLFCWSGKTYTSGNKILNIVPNSAWTESGGRIQTINNSWYYNRSKQGTQTDNGTTEKSPNTLYCFATNSNGVLKCFNDQEMKVFALRIYENKEIVRNFVPCYSQNESAYGLFDYVTQEFFVNQGTGDFEGELFEDVEEETFRTFDQYFTDRWMVNDISTTTITGTGAENDPYIINSSEDFWWSTKYVNNNNKFFELGCDVVLNEEKFDEDGNVVPGTSQDGRAYIWYSGRNGSGSMVFDGKGHTIYGLYVHNFNYEYAQIGLFTWAKEFKNVNGRDFYIYSTNYVGGFVSNVELIENCHQLSGFMRATGSCVGGIAFSASVVRNCTNRMKIIAKNGSGSGPVAGIVFGKYPWKTADLIENCINYADINAYYGSGIGQAKIIKNCVNYGNISGSNYCGGMTGRAENFAFINCVNYGTIETSDLGAGGMIGRVSDDLTNPLQFIGCENYGQIIAKGRGNGGLFVGYGVASMIFKNCKAESKGSGQYYCRFDNKHKWVIENCEQTITEYQGNAAVFPSTSLEIRNFKLIVKSSSIFSQNFYLADNKKSFNAKNILIESDFNFTTKLFSSNNDQSALCMENIIIKTPTQKWYCGSDFSGFYVSWRTGQIGLASLDYVGSFANKLSVQNLQQMGFSAL